MENILKQLEELRERVQKTAALLKLEGQRSTLQGLERQMERPDFWQDQNKAKAVSRQQADIRAELARWDDLLKRITELEELVLLAQAEKGGTDDAFADDMRARLVDLVDEFAKLEFLVLFDGIYDAANAIVTIHAGSGGVDAQDWAQLLERMYLRFSEKKKWDVEVIERTPGNEAGIKSMTVQVSGRWAYGFFKSEAGVHRLVRISPFDAESMRHTSFALVEVVPELPEAAAVDIKDDDIRIDVFRSGGAGGQSVNTTDSAVRIVHQPTGITVTCQNERSQAQNKETAFKILRAKLFQLAEKERAEAEAKLRGETLAPEWGNQIRSYVMQPYRMVKDHRTNIETADVGAVLDGDLESFVEGYLRWERGGRKKTKG